MCLGFLQVLSSHSTKLALKYKAVKLLLQIRICMQVQLHCMRTLNVYVQPTRRMKIQGLNFPLCCTLKFVIPNYRDIAYDL